MATDALKRRKEIQKQIYKQRNKKNPDYKKELKTVSKQIASNKLNGIPPAEYDKAILGADEDTADRIRRVRDQGPTEDDIKYFQKKTRRE